MRLIAILLLALLPSCAIIRTEPITAENAHRWIPDTPVYNSDTNSTGAAGK